MKHIYIFSVFRNIPQVWATSNFICWGTKQKLFLRIINSFSFEIDYLLGRKYLHNFSFGVSSCPPVSKANFAFSQGNIHEINPPHNLQFFTCRSCQYMCRSLAFHVLFPQMLVSGAFAGFGVFFIFLHTDSSYIANHHKNRVQYRSFGAHFGSNQHMKEKFTCHVLPIYHYSADNCCSLLAPVGQVNFIHMQLIDKVTHLLKSKVHFVVLFTHN